ncbi:flagellar hook-associated protein 3 FlgL [Acidovorax sp. 93]|jgi:flagellar hook-associated protein 3 FlgL|uniref:Flagellar hook-associated protein FlgL n=1 Tax=Acidovorax facilis TaxID=12917 RepID=A0ABV8DGM4_9BURK|nr:MULTISPECIES: flagellar hook-associated protein FlgL [Acidovorax]MBT9441122.1 flagellar hook-associated protein FlgL [Acidovorax sp.]OGA57797.1 MAG: flagellar hook-associated protein 3 [Burkholderiales bacterium RIFCSPHIGHO2_01_FULL_64_960]OGB06725.1 MAG: flagellar hook-associated protein 3 [Burkholderiales bacterium RIFCSPHIGHO2_02_FULL_64_19]OGB16477.1 MAG: flagellar hook-associated protein 3 [Burkholderiales bacterium RIFCSPHIGHO2_12_FULL_65_48]OGB57320.1 MAG: flagellar hook-associated p
MSNSIYRLGTANMYDNALRNLGTRQTNLSNLQENLTSGKRVVRASDDPVSAAQAERAINRLARIQTEQRALETQRNAIAQAESALGDAVDLVQNFRELVVNAGSAALTPNDRNTIANQLQGLREQLLEVANRKDTNGVPLLSALGSALAPFLGPLSTSPDYSFEGLPGQTASSGVSIPNTLDGEAAFMFDPQRDGVYTAGVSAIPSSRFLNTTAVTPVDPSLVTGDNYTITFSAVGPGATPGTTTATYTLTNTTTGAVSPAVVVPDYPTDKPVTIAITSIPGLSFDIKGNPATGDTITLQPSPSMFSTLDNAIRDIRSAPDSNAAAQAVGQALGNMDIGLERLHNMRGYAGELLNRADRITGDQEKRSIQLEGDRSRAEDLDMIQGISDFQNQQVGYEAALKSYAQVQKLSLFNFIS